MSGLISIASKFLGNGRCKRTPISAKAAASLTDKTIAVAQLIQETDVLSPVKTTLDDFDICYGPDVITTGLKNRGQLGGQIGGFATAMEDFGGGKITMVPIMSAIAVPGGPIENAVFARFKKEILDGLRAIKKLDGIYLSLHGATGVEGLNDPEGDLLQAIRDEFGVSLPIATTYDLHGNMTEKKVKLATFIVAYKTSPHRDQFATGYKTGEILVKTVQGEVHPVMTVTKMRLLKGGGQTIDFLPPMDSILDRMKAMEKMPGVLSVSNFTVYIWMDNPDVGWSTVAVTDNDKALAEKLAGEIADLNWAARDYPVNQKLYSPSEAVKEARDSRLARLMGTIIFCDLSDTVGSGGPGESTWILKALLEEGHGLVSYVPVRDSQAVKDLWELPLNQIVTLTVGGKLDKVYNQPVKFTGKIIYKGNARGGNKASIRSVVLKSNGVRLVLTEFGDAQYHPSFYTSLGLNPWKADIVVVKNLFPFRYNFALYNRKTLNVATPGTTNIDVFQIKYNNLPRPIYPLDHVDSWQGKKW